MSKDKKKTQPAAEQAEVVLTPDVPATPATPPTPPTVNASGVPLGSVVPVPLPAAPTRLMDIDRMALELARQQRATALAEARTALAQNEKAELAYKYVVLQLYMKYGLTDADAISETGDIVKGGALPQNQPK
jgi:hypothetical protein